jgi:hypothetical protein
MPEDHSSTSNPDATKVSTTTKLPDASNGKSTSSQKKRRWLPQVLIALAILVILSGVVGVSIYQNHVNQVNTTQQTNKTATATTQLKETATAQHNAYLSALAGNGTLVFTDSLNQENGSQWHTDADGETTCQFAEGAYHIKPQSRHFKECNVHGTYSNLAFEVEMTITQGRCGGIVFRDNEKGDFYSFSVYQDGKYDIARYADYGIFEHLLPYGHSSAIHTGFGKLNKLAVKASGSTLIFYVNEQQIQQLQDKSGYASGSIGFAAYPNIGDEADVSFTNARLWTL